MRMNISYIDAAIATTILLLVIYALQLVWPL